MAKIVFLSRGNEGHLFQALHLATILRARGHEVRLVSYLDKAQSIAKQYDIPLSELNLRGAWIRPSGLLLTVLGTLAGRYADFVRIATFQRLAVCMLRNGLKIVEEYAPDIAIVDQNVIAGSTVCDRLKIPFVTIATSVLWHAEAGVVPHYVGWSYGTDDKTLEKNRTYNRLFEWYMWPVLAVINRYRRRWQLEPLRHTADLFSKRAQLSQLCPAFDFPRRDLPKCFHYIGTFGAKRKSSSSDFPWDKLDGRPLIFASMGTVKSKRNFEVFRKISKACETLNAQLVMSLGRYSESVQQMIDEFGTLPNNQLIVGFAPQVELLKRASLLITHAGVNTVLEAISSEVPMVALPRNVDHPAMATRIEYSGVGLRDSLRNFTPDSLREKIDRVLSDPTFKERLKFVREDLEQCGGAERAADIIEKCLDQRTT